MRIEIKNFGPISNMSFDLKKDLHLIYGENAIGKSYGAYCVYCLLKNFKNINYDNSSFFYLGRSQASRDIEHIVKNVLKKIKTSNKNEFINLNSVVEEFIITQLSLSILPGIINSFQNTFSSLSNLKNRYSDEYYNLTFHLDNSQMIIGSDEYGKAIITSFTLNNAIQGILKDTKTTKFSIYTNHKKTFGVANEKHFTLELAKYIVGEIAFTIKQLQDNINEIYFLPASRSGLYQALNAFTPIMAEMTQNRFFIQNRNIELPSLPEPLADYFIDLSTLKTSHLNKEFDNIISTIENDILHGKVEYDDDAKKIIYIPHNLNLRLDLSEASSMVSELSPIVIFLRHIISNKYQSSRRSTYNSPFTVGFFPRKKERTNFNSILFIEEPEAHLHPEIQVKIMSVFTKLIKFGIKIIMTSHSNYMLNKLNNLILDKEMDSSKIEVYHLIRTPQGCVVNQDMSISNEGIYDDNFTNITRKLYDERMNILEKDE